MPRKLNSSSSSIHVQVQVLLGSLVEEGIIPLIKNKCPTPEITIRKFSTCESCASFPPLRVALVIHVVSLAFTDIWWRAAHHSDVWETVFCQQMCGSVTWHVFDTPPTRV